MTPHPAPTESVRDLRNREASEALEPTRYTIVVRGRLSERFAMAFPGVTIDPGEGRTKLQTEPFDQGQLQGLLNRVWSFGLELVSVHEGHDRSRPQTTQGDSGPG
jgi:hypothetical protein